MLYGVVRVILGIAVLVEHPLVTDGRTDRHTHTHNDIIYRVV